MSQTARRAPSMGWIAATVIALLWGSLAVWALATSGPLVFGVGGIALTVAFAVLAIRQWRRSREQS